MNGMSIARLAACLLLVTAAHEAAAQWTTETFELKSGWTAFYLHIDPSHATINTLLAADPNSPIDEIWLWVPGTGAMQFYDSPEQPTDGSTQWLKWTRNLGPASPLQRLVPNAAYLISVRRDYTWTLTGRPVPPHLSWTSTGMNFLGFSTPRAGPPTWESFLGPDTSLHAYAEIYFYPGGKLGSKNPMLLLDLRNARVRRGQAYWVRAEEYNRYFGPFELSLQSAGGILFHDRLGQYRLRLNNATNQSITVTGTLLPSVAPPAGQIPIADTPPLLMRGELDLTDLTYAFTRFSEGPQTWSLAPRGQPGSEIEITLGLDRSLMSGQPGTVFAGILRLSDSLGHSQFDLPVSAEVASDAGLWVGNALVTEVQHYLAEYELTNTGGPAQAADGSYIVTGIDESLGPVSRPFPLRLIVHNSGQGDARLLQRVYIGHQTTENVVIARRESVLHPSLLSAARRISVVHLPWSDENVSWAFSGRLRLGADISVTVPIHYDDQASNPFVHSYHPDHDNRDATFNQTLPQGFESYGVTRILRLQVIPPLADGDFVSLTGSSTTLSGLYEETLILEGRNGAQRQLQTRGAFALNRISDIATIAD